MSQSSESHFICLSSDACLDHFPKNSLNSFTNRLPAVLRNRGGRRFYIRLKSISICTGSRYYRETPDFSYVKIHIYEIEAQKEGRESAHFAGGFSYPPEKRASDDYALHTFRHSPNLLVRFQELDKLHVRLTDEANNPVEIPPGPPTIIFLEITDMEPTEEFTITCISQQPDTYPSNSLAKFTVPLPNQMHLKGYEVSLLQVVYPPEMKETIIASLKVNNYVWHYNLSNMASTTQFIHAVQRDLAHSEYGGYLRFKRLGMNTDSPMAGRLAFLVSYRYKWRERGLITVHPSPNFAKVCGQVMEPRLKTTMKTNDIFFFRGFGNIALGQETPVAMLHCDIVKPNVMGGTQARLLQCVPILANAKQNAKRLYEPPELAFQPVSDSPISRIGFEFGNPDGSLRRFRTEDPDCYVMITLLFRKRK